MKLNKLFILPILLLLCSSANAACAGGSPTWTTTPDQASVQTCINSSVAGDIVNISAGSATWSTLVTLSKAITLNGAGVGVTNITLGTLSPIFQITKQVGGVTRLSNITFIAGAGNTVFPFGINVGGPWPTGQPVIFQNDAFVTATSDMIGVSTPGGVILSHSTFNGTWDTRLIVIKDTGTASWTTADTMGTRDTTGFNNVYIEDNQFVGGSNGITDCDDSCRMVVRHNIFGFGGQDSGGVNSHGDDSSPQGMRHFEIYNNSFLFPDKTCAGGNSSLSNINQFIWIRGGTGIIANNNFDSLYSPACWGDKTEVKLNNRGAEDDRPLGIPCNAVTYPTTHQLGQNYNGSSLFTDPINFSGNTANGGADAGGTFQINVSAGWGWANPCFSTYQTLGYGNTNSQQWSHFFQWGRDAANTSVGVNLCNSGTNGCNVDGIGGAAKVGYTPSAYPHPLVTNLSAAPNPLNFGNITTLATSGALTVTITNSGGSSLVLATPFFALATGNPGDFTKTGGTAADGGTITAGGSKTVTFTATPGAAGLRQTVLTISLNPAGASASTTLQVTGVAGTVPGVTLTTNGGPASPFNFGTVNTGTLSAPQTFTLLNSGNASLTITSIVSSDGVSFPLTNGCGGSLGAGLTCTVSDTFSPAVPAAVQTASITVTSNSPSSPDVITLNGTGFTSVASPPPVSSNPIISAVPLPLQPIIVSVSPSTTYVAKQGCSQNGHGWANPCTFRVLCTNCSAATLLTLDGVAVAQSYAAGVMTATVPLTALPVPSTITAHSFSAVNPIPLIN